MSRLISSLVVALGFALVLSACDSAPGGDPDPTNGAPPALSGSWEPAPDAPFPGSLAGRVSVPASGEAVVSITLRNARFTGVPGPAHRAPSANPNRGSPRATHC